MKNGCLVRFSENSAKIFTIFVKRIFCENLTKATQIDVSYYIIFSKFLERCFVR